MRGWARLETRPRVVNTLDRTPYENVGGRCVWVRCRWH